MIRSTHSRHKVGQIGNTLSGRYFLIDRPTTVYTPPESRSLSRCRSKNFMTFSCSAIDPFLAFFPPPWQRLIGVSCIVTPKAAEPVVPLVFPCNRTSILLHYTFLRLTTRAQLLSHPFVVTRILRRVDFSLRHRKVRMPRRSGCSALGQRLLTTSKVGGLTVARWEPLHGDATRRLRRTSLTTRGWKRSWTFAGIGLAHTFSLQG